MKKVRGFLKKYACYEGTVWYGMVPILDDDIRDDAAKDGWTERLLFQEPYEDTKKQLCWPRVCAKQKSQHVERY